MNFEKKALDLLSSPHFFPEVLKAVAREGLIGEEENALVVYLVASSRHLPKSLHLFVKGHSSAGKNYLVKRVLRLIPPKHVMEFTSTSDRSWEHLGKKAAHKVIYLQEQVIRSGAIHPSRLLISEDKLIRLVTVRKNGRLSTVKYVTRGPVSCIATTTTNRLKFDDESRRISLWIDESPEQTHAILMGSTEPTVKLSESEIKVWHVVQKLLAKRARLQIAPPDWYPRVARMMHYHDLRMRRYSEAFLSACQTVCLIRSFRDKRISESQSTPIRMSFVDIAVAYLILGKALDDSLAGHGEPDDPDIREVVDAISDRKKGKAVNTWEVAHELGLSMDQAYRLIRRAVEYGALERVNRPEQANRKFYNARPVPRFLPEPEEMFERVGRLRGWHRVKFVHPVTGKWLAYDPPD